MGKLDKEQEARMAGMRYALGIAKEKGVDGLQKELQMRGALGIGLLIDNDKLKKAYEILAETIYQNTITVVLATLAHDSGFGEKRLRRFKEAYDKNTLWNFELDGYAEHYVTYVDMAMELKTKYNIDMNVEMLASNQDITFDKEGNASYNLIAHGQEKGRITLKVKGRHNVMNSLAAIACTEAIGLPFDTIRKGLLSFGGTHRRFEYKGSLGDVTVIDDYAHHPTEIRATLSAAKDYPHDELWVIFQPHTYTRTKAFLPEFAKALEQADHIVLADIYAAREVDTGEVSSKDVMKLLQEDGQDVHYFPSFEEIKDFVKAHVKGHDLLITMGAGNVVEIGEELLAEK